MAVKFTVNEGSTLVVEVITKDELDVLIIPTSMKWSLTDREGNVINSREDVVVLTPSSSIDIVLKGADLELVTTKLLREERFLLVESIYDGLLGSNLPITNEFSFIIKNLRGI
jgi:hypothetical protein